MADQVGGLTAAGLPLAPGLRALADEIRDDRFFGSLRLLPAAFTTDPWSPSSLISTMRSMADALDAGASLDEAIAAQGSRVPGHLRGLVLAGSRTGKVSEVFGRFAGLQAEGDELRRRLTVSLAYPGLALLLAIAVMAFACSALVGSFTSTFKDFGIPLPGVTIVLISISRALGESWVFLFELIVTLLIAFFAARAFLTAPVRRSLLRGIPVVGAVWRSTSLSEFCHLLALLLESEVPLGEALRLTGNGVCDRALARDCTGLSRAVESGLTLSESVSRQGSFPRGMPRILKWAESQGSLPDALRMVGEMFAADARAQAGYLGTVASVLAFLTILFGVTFVVLGVIWPMMTLISRLAG
jgi:general secretion pathway protein F